MVIPNGRGVSQAHCERSARSPGERRISWVTSRGFGFETLSMTLIDIDGYQWISIEYRLTSFNIYLTLFNYKHIIYIYRYIRSQIINGYGMGLNMTQVHQIQWQPSFQRRALPINPLPGGRSIIVQASYLDDIGLKNGCIYIYIYITLYIQIHNYI